MTSDAPVVSDDSHLLCEACGYVLTGLPTDSRCPECGTPIADSIGTDRLPAPWEDPADSRSAARRFLVTTASVLFRESHFFRHLQTRRLTPRPRAFAWIHWSCASLVAGAAVWLHLVWYADVAYWNVTPLLLAASFLLPLPIFLAILFLTHLVILLTVWEARLRGLRLTRPVVRRALSYHAPHYWPPILLCLAITGGMHLLTLTHFLEYYAVGANYLYALAGAVVAGALYFFFTYWAAMRPILFANR